MKLYKIIVHGVVLSCSSVIWTSLILAMDPGAVQPNQTAQEALKWDRESLYDEGLTTTADENDTRGNWYIKRKFLIDARTLYEKIKQRVPEIVELQKTFLDMHDTMTHEVAQFYTDIGLEAHELELSLTATLKSLEEERLKDVQLTEQERETLANLEVLKKEFSQIIQDNNVLHDNENAVNRALSVLMQQIELCKNYEQQAWDKYDKISEVLNEHLAEQLYRDLQSFLNHIEAIDAYIKGQFLDYFNQTLSMIRTQTSSIKTALDHLKEKGIVFESQAAKEQAARKAQEETQKAEKHQQAQQEKQPWYNLIFEWLKNLGSYIAFPFVFLGKQVSRIWS